MDPLDNHLENISDKLLNYLSNSCRKPIDPAGDKRTARSPIIFDLIAGVEEADFNYDQKSLGSKNCSCSYHADYDKPQIIEPSAATSPQVKWNKHLTFLRIMTWLKSCVKKDCDVSVNDIRKLVEQLKKNRGNKLKRSEPTRISMMIKRKKKKKNLINDDDFEVVKIIRNGTEINYTNGEVSMVKTAKKSVLPEKDVEDSQHSPEVSFGEDSIPKKLFSQGDSIADSGVGLQDSIGSQLESQMQSESNYSLVSESVESFKQSKSINSFKRPHDVKIQEIQEKDYPISSQQLMLVFEECQLDDFALTITRTFLDDFVSEETLNNIYENKTIVVEALQTIGDFVNQLERRENTDVSICHFFVKCIVSTIKNIFSNSSYKNLTNMQRQLCISVVLELNKSPNILKETLNFLITELLDLTMDETQLRDSRLKNSIDRQQLLILYGLETVITKYSAMLKCEAAEVNDESTSEVTRMWRRNWVSYINHLSSPQQQVPAEDLNLYLKTNLNILLANYKSTNSLKTEWVSKLICLLSE
ncbi:uncharacterized protein LOC130676088 [Microplitis mediator]|uniref:uncharacterized protein LOC130676088 n=1 Tax=Microplitis mediator TaxID=375433 RepID=UPI0025569F5E|nr:uncharacterized protein LOC130676088 [Microplitis mediator]